MNRLMIAGVALAAGIAITAPMLAWSADSPPPSAQSAPAAPAQQGMGGMQGMHAMTGPEGMGAMGHHRGWMREMMMHRMSQFSPQQRCEERLARRAGMIAYTIAKVNLTQQQRPSWDRLEGLLQQAAARQHQLCDSLKTAGAPGQETILDRVSRREQFLSARLEGLQKIRPALEQFYQGLTPEQQAIINHRSSFGKY